MKNDCLQTESECGMNSNTQETFSQRVLRDMNDAVLVLDRQGLILYINEPASRMLEISQEYTPGKTRFLMDFSENYNDNFYECVMDALYRKQESHVHTVNYKAPSGRKYVFRMTSSYLEDRTRGLVITLADETEMMQLRERVQESSKMFSIFLYAFCIWIILYALWEFGGQPFASKHMTRGVELLGIVMFVYIARYTKLSRKDLGIAPEKPWESIKIGILASLGAVAFLFQLKAIARFFSPGAFEPDKPFWDIAAFGVPQLIYIFTAGIQEFLARSVMQSNLNRIIEGKYAAVSSIILSSLIFAGLHIHLGFLFMIGAVILASLEGFLFEKQHSVYSVWLFHWVFGVTGTMLHLIDH